MTIYRSWMFVPGTEPKKLQKAMQLNSDAIIFDLEDAVAPHQKDTARHLVKAAIQTNGDRLNFVRVNTIHSAFFYEDVEELVIQELMGIVLPKVESSEQVLILDHFISHLERKRSLVQGSIEIMPIIESAQGLYHSFDIAGSSKRVKRLAFGGIDFSDDINAQSTREGTELLFARSQLVVNSRAAGIEAPIDTVYTHIKDSEGLSKETAQIKLLGFQGKLVIHPAQIDIIHDIFRPTLDEIAEAELIVSAFNEAVTNGSGVVEVKGKMVDLPVVNRARRLIIYAQK